MTHTATELGHRSQLRGGALYPVSVVALVTVAVAVLVTVGAESEPDEVHPATSSSTVVMVAGRLPGGATRFHWIPRRSVTARPRKRG
jgi:hypothetical protein